MGRKRFRWWGALIALIPVFSAVIWWRDPPRAQLVADLSNRTITVRESGTSVRTYGIAIGTQKHPTPTGSFRTGDIVWNPSWRPPPSGWARNKKYQPPGAAANPMQGVKIYFKAPWYFIHGTNNPGSIGEAASHGCIRMTEDDAVELGRWIERQGGSVSLIIQN